LELLTRACAAGDAEARDFFDLEMNRARYRSLLPPSRPSGCETDNAAPAGTLAQNPASRPTYWDFNESVFSLVAKGQDRKFYYHAPREGLTAVGVTRGTLFFDGSRNGKKYSGNAYVFSKPCGPASYAVTGTVSDDEREVVLSGQAPRRNARCEVVNYVEEPIKLTLEAAVN
jgi:hypothetical protein